MLLIHVTCILDKQLKFEDFQSPFVNVQYKKTITLQYHIFSILLVIYNDILDHLDYSKNAWEHEGWMNITLPKYKEN